MFMKQMKFFLVALMAVVMSVSVTSCMNGDNESAYDLGVYATVVDDITSVTLIGDDGNVYYPENASALKPVTETSYPKRVFAFLKYSEGITSSSAKKIVKIVDSSSLYTRSLCMQPDTIKNDIPLAGLSDFGLLNSMTTSTYNNIPAYCNVLFKVRIDNSATVIDLVPVTASGNELTVKLQQTVGNENASYETTAYASFNLPSVSEINSALARATEGDAEAPVLTADSEGKIKIKVIGVGRGNQSYALPAKEVKIN